MPSKRNRQNECEIDLISKLMDQIPPEQPIDVLRVMIQNSMKEFSKRAKRYRVWYYITKFTSFVAPLVITTITSLPIHDQKIYIVLLSLLASLAVGISGMGMFHDNWIRNRYYCEQLKYEVMQYASDTEEYDGKNDDDKLDLLGKRIHSILKSENREWRETAEREYNAATTAAAADASNKRNQQQNNSNT